MTEINLLSAVLERAILDILGGTDYRQQVETYRWFKSDKIETMSFLWICEWLDLESDYILNFVKVMYLAPDESKKELIVRRGKGVFRSVTSYLSSDTDITSMHDIKNGL